MKRELMITAGAVAILGVALAGCSHSDTVRTANGAVAATSNANTKVLVDGKDQSVKGTVACTTAAGNLSIAIGGSTSGAPTGIGAVLSDANPPVVKSVALGNVNGVTLGVGGTATPTRSPARRAARTCPTRWLDRSTSRSKST